MKITTLTQKYGKYLATLVVGLIIGGFTMQMASASVPDGNGTIHGCRNNITTMLRVIDSASQTCGSDEAGLNWDQNGVKAYARVVYNGTTYSIDSSHSKNFSAIYTDGSTSRICLTAAAVPTSVTNIPEAGGGATGLQATFKDQSTWIGSNACDYFGSGANIEILLNDPGTFLVTVF